MKTLFYTLMASGLFLTAAMAGDDVAVADLPKPVTDAIEAGFSGAKLIKAEKDIKKGAVVYEVTIEHNKMRRELDVKEDGEILEVGTAED